MNQIKSNCELNPFVRPKNTRDSHESATRGAGNRKREENDPRRRRIAEERNSVHGHATHTDRNLIQVSRVRKRVGTSLSFFSSPINTSALLRLLTACNVCTRATLKPLPVFFNFFFFVASPASHDGRSREPWSIARKIEESNAKRALAWTGSILQLPLGHALTQIRVIFQRTRPTIWSLASPWIFRDIYMCSGNFFWRNIYQNIFLWRKYSCVGSIFKVGAGDFWWINFFSRERKKSLKERLKELEEVAWRLFAGFSWFSWLDRWDKMVIADVILLKCSWKKK